VVRLPTSVRIPLGDVVKVARDPFLEVKPSLRQYSLDLGWSRVNHDGLGPHPVDDATNSRLD
jgi:hypothetical protein